MDEHEPHPASHRTGDQDLRDRTVDGLRVIAEAIQKASDVLSAAEPGSLAALLDRAAGNLENLSARLQDKTAGEVARDMRRVAGESPAAVIAGNVLASFALGAEAGTFFPSADPGHPAGTTEAPIQTAQTGAGGLGYLEKPDVEREKAASS